MRGTGYRQAYAKLESVMAASADRPGEELLTVGQATGPVTVQPGESRTFVLDDPAGSALFGAAATPPDDCAAAAPVFWRVTAPGGTETLQLPACSDAGRLTTTGPGRWRLDVAVDAGAPAAGTATFSVLAAGQDRSATLVVPATPDTAAVTGVRRRPR